jgi:hypothetical protein
VKRAASVRRRALRGEEKEEPDVEIRDYSTISAFVLPMLWVICQPVPALNFTMRRRPGPKIVTRWHRCSPLALVTHVKTGDGMRGFVISGALTAALTFGLSSCVYVPVEPVPAYRYVAPAPLAPYPPVAYRRCGHGWHWVGGHYNQRGRWVPSHCARNWVNPSDRTAKEPPPPAPSAPAPSSPAQPTPPQTSP